MPYMLDPPEGHKFGFPKRAPANVHSKDFSEAELAEWLVENSYPRDLLELYQAQRHTRVFYDPNPS